ncbi:MAG: hypothetical protein ACLR2E_04180 [Lachnospiraceae bacterium]
MGRFVNPIPQICLPPIIAKAVILKNVFRTGDRQLVKKCPAYYSGGVPLEISSLPLNRFSPSFLPI